MAFTKSTKSQGRKERLDEKIAFCCAASIGKFVQTSLLKGPGMSVPSVLSLKCMSGLGGAFRKCARTAQEESAWAPQRL